MKLLIDGDIFLYRVGFASQNDSERFAIARLHSSIAKLVKQTNATTYEVFVSDTLENNFRYSLFPLYKGNRTIPKPTHYQALTNAIVEEYQATIAYGEEADDALGIESTNRPQECIIASIDKDLLQVPGIHFNWVNGVWRDIRESEGRYRFYKQLLTGDAVDNITPKVGLSCPGVGHAKAELYLEGCESEGDYTKTIWEVFKRHCKEHDEVELHHRIEVTGQLVKIRQHKDEVWKYERT